MTERLQLNVSASAAAAADLVGSIGVSGASIGCRCPRHRKAMTVITTTPARFGLSATPRHVDRLDNFSGSERGKVPIRLHVISAEEEGSSFPERLKWNLRLIIVLVNGDNDGESKGRDLCGKREARIFVRATDISKFRIA